VWHIASWVARSRLFDFWSVVRFSSPLQSPGKEVSSWLQ
jgi:hypothetical protein